MHFERKIGAFRLIKPNLLAGVSVLGLSFFLALAHQTYAKSADEQLCL